MAAGPASPANTRRLVLLGLLLLAVVFAIYRLRRFTQSSEAPPSAFVPNKAVANGRADPSVAKSHPSAEVVPDAGSRATRRDRATRDEVRERIYGAFGSPPLSPLTGAKGDRTTFGTDSGTLDKAYIQKRIREDFVPLAKECYAAALERDAKLGGKLVFSFVIVGDEDVGGVVESAELDPTSTLVEKELVYCLRESLLSLSFEPPKEGGMVTVTYPFVFSPDAPDSDGGRR
jgi:hypothetical protein